VTAAEMAVLYDGLLETGLTREDAIATVVAAARRDVSAVTTTRPRWWGEPQTGATHPGLRVWRTS
jgi:hypothetical protein